MAPRRALQRAPPAAVPFVRAVAGSEQILIDPERRPRAHSWGGGESTQEVYEFTHVAGELGTCFGEVRKPSLCCEPCSSSVDGSQL